MIQRTNVICRCANSYNNKEQDFSLGAETQNVSCWCFGNDAISKTEFICDLTMKTGPTLPTKKNLGQDHYDTFTDVFLFS